MVTGTSSMSISVLKDTSLNAAYMMTTASAQHSKKQRITTGR